MTVRSLARADDELADAIRYYHRAGGPELATRFLNAFDAAINHIGADPESLPVFYETERYGPVRRCPLGRPWPYDVLFTLGRNAVAVVSVWDYRRNPADRPA
ncbi:type II toxin-antitoxin system RelE/ParE family toxin [Alienimonas sp. DA493]|uniref:type II toxin-antitoxin system RelE/ParE family toxin n=1 Tax=Alienimonas sp. DA493 TaxID=3373605 RepID=UPI0037540E38